MPRRQLIIFFFLALLPPLPAPAGPLYGPYTLIAPVAVDGDTLRADVAIWPDQVVDVSIRVREVDTPELRGATACERALAEKARQYTDSWLLENSPITITRVAPDKYAGRIDAVVTGKTGRNLASDLIAAGHGRPYSGGARQPWCL